MKLKQLESILEDVATFEEPDYNLEQYKTSSRLAAQMLFTIQNAYGEIDGAVIGGTGVLTIAAHVMGAARTVSVDVDESALAIAKRNIEEYELEDDAELIHMNIDSDTLRDALAGKGISTIVMNPPFGTRTKGIDMVFVKAAIDIATTSVYSLHKSSTRKHILKQAQKWGVEAKVLAEVQFDIPAMYKFHRKKHVDVAVDFIRFGIPAGRNDRAKAAKAEASDAADADDGAAATAPAPATATATTAAETTEPATAAAATGGAGAGGGAGAADSEDVGATLSDDLTNKAVIQA